MAMALALCACTTMPGLAAATATATATCDAAAATAATTNALTTAFTAPTRCNIPRVAAADLTVERFIEEYQDARPVIVVHPSGSQQYQAAFAAQTAAAALRERWGGQLVTLGTANTHTGQATKQTPLREYLDYLDATDFTALGGNETWYLFGDQVEDFWDSFLEAYRWPPLSNALLALDPLGYHRTAAFGIGGAASGVPFHTHGGGWSEVIHGAKHWYLFDLEASREHPQADREQSQWAWTQREYPQLSDHQRAGLYECTIVPGEALYFPPHWFHATLNAAPYTVFVSSFT